MELKVDTKSKELGFGNRTVLMLEYLQLMLQETLDLAPVGAILNLAIILKDALFENQTSEAFLMSLAPKARAAILLDGLTMEMCPQLKHFVIFSSVSCGRGNAGQTNYGMATSVMERVCESSTLFYILIIGYLITLLDGKILSVKMCSNNRIDDPNYQYGRWLSSCLPGEEVVISGMSGRLPESNNIYEFRDHLFNKEDMVTDDDRRWKLEHPEIPKRSAKIYDIDKYDPGFFGVHYRQAHNFDPMIRVFMENVIEAVMDAGVNPKELEGTKTGVFVSACTTDADDMPISSEPQQFKVTGRLKTFITQRVSYYLKLKGPCFGIDTACSSFLNDLDSAFKAIRHGQCENALVGCANLLLYPSTTRQFFRMGILSSDGTCKVFDEDAKGYVRGEGISCLFLQKAKNSRRIYAQIINTKANSDGYKEESITFPSFQAQTILLTEIYDESRIAPSELSYLEAHGTGTPVGDPQEVHAIDTAVAQKRDKPLLVGSVKSNIGHLEVSSGASSVIKVLIAMDMGLIAPNIHFKRLKKGLKGIEEGRMKVVTELTELQDEDAVIGVNNFGFGGSNVHVILRRNPKKKIADGKPRDDLPRLVCVSGRSEEAVQNLLDGSKLDFEYIGLLHQIFKTNVSGHPFRGYAIITKSGVVKTSSKFVTSQPPFYVFFDHFDITFKVVASYLSKFPLFKDTIERIVKLLKEKNVTKYDDLLKNWTDTRYDLFGSICVQIAIVDMLKHLDVTPTAVYAESNSKLVAAYHYDVINFEETVSFAAEASELDFNCNFQTSFNNEMVEASIHDSLDKLCKDFIILNVSDCALNERDLLMVDGVTFLDVLGRLYENGYTPQLHKLYPEIEYPVSRNTPMISPLIQWNHDKSWFTSDYDNFVASDFLQQQFRVTYMNDDNKFISGHVIDGRNLFPATEYLRLVWETLAQSRFLTITDFQVVFTNCKFLRAVTMSKNSYLTFLVTIQKGSGQFEVLENDSLVVSGFIHLGVEECSLKPIEFKPNDAAEVLQHEEIYRELYLRGYQYSGLFKGIQKCSVDGSVGLVKWENNWSAFIDNMLQMIIMQADSRLLYVPVGIKKLSINPKKHFEVIEQLEKSLMPVNVYKDANMIKSGGIELCGLQAKSISKKKPQLEPVLEKHVFVPNFSFLNLPDAVRVNTQIILENFSGNNFKAVEIVDELTHLQEFLLHFVCEALDDIPMVIPDLTISSKAKIEEFPGVKVSSVTLTPEHNLLLLVGTKLLQSPNLKEMMTSLSPNGFILTRENVEFIPETTTDIEILTAFTTDKEKIVMFRASKPVLKTKFIEVSSTKFEWLPEVKSALNKEENVAVFSKNVEPEGTLGFVNCIRREPNGSKVKCFFIMDETLDYQSQLRGNLAVNVYKNGIWGTYRHLRLDEEPEVECEHCFANVTNRGDISSFKWFQGELSESTPLPKRKVLVSTYYSAVNFKDIMIASGRVSVDVCTQNRLDHECPIGFEFSGRDSSGNRVAGMVANKALSSHIVADSSFLWNVPEWWSLEEAATVPAVYSTVLYALLMTGQMKRRSSILIHSATGGIGLAALNVCLHYECEIFVTVGTQAKRDYLNTHYPQILNSHIGNSRNTSFEQMIKTGTEGRGVDFVLNSLSDDKLMASGRCLAKGGCFLEIGKFDLANDTTLHLLLLERGASYHGIMLDEIIPNNEEKKSELYQLMCRGIKEGFVKPLPRVVFNRDEVEASYRHMMTGKHIGKVLVKIRDEEKEKIVIPRKMKFYVKPRFNCDVRLSYIIIGGLGGVGLELADWLMLRGARKLILVSRNGVQSGYQKQRIGLWKSYGVDVKVSLNDVTTKVGCSDLLKDASDLAPVGAIFNLAVILKDALFENQTPETFMTSLAPKARTTILLDELTREMCPQLKHFVIFSSVSCGRGNAGQTNYGMANSVMERVCERRKAEGLPAVAIQWGAIGDVGLVAKMQKENKELVIGGTLQQKISSCLEVLDKFLTQGNPVVSSMVVAEKFNRRSGVVTAVDTVANVLGIKDLKTISLHSTLAELGMDSMMGTEIIQLLENQFDIYITPQETRNLTFARLAEIEDEKAQKNKEVSLTKPNESLFMYNISNIYKNDLPIIELNNNKSELVAFLLPGLDGNLRHLEMLNRLNVRLLGLQYDHFDFGKTVQGLVIKILPHIEKTISKDKEFIFIGYSFGSDVSLELAAHLEKRGYTGRIILIDGSPTYLSAATKSHHFIQEDEDFDNAILQHILALWLPEDEQLRSKDQFLKCCGLLEKIDLTLSLIPSKFLKEEQNARAALIGFLQRSNAMINYSFSHDRIKSDVHLIKAELPFVDDGDDYQLSKLCEKPVPVTTVKGDHSTMLHQSNIFEIVNKIFVQ